MADEKGPLSEVSDVRRMSRARGSISWESGANNKFRKASIGRLSVISTEYAQTRDRKVSIVDDVFGEITEDGPNYRAVRNLLMVRSWPT